jgi:hypothetical protein
LLVEGLGVVDDGAVEESVQLLDVDAVERSIRWPMPQSRTW